MVSLFLVQISESSGWWVAWDGFGALVVASGMHFNETMRIVCASCRGVLLELART